MGRVEVFPKQDRLVHGECGNFINLPLFGALVESGKTVFVDDAFTPVKNQWAYLASVKVSVPGEIVEQSVVASEPLTTPSHVITPPSAAEPGFLWHTYGLPPCSQRMLAAGVGEFQRVACFRLAVALRLAGLPRDAVLAVLSSWGQKNAPTDGKQRISVGEITAQVNSAFRARMYRGYGCSDPAIRQFCARECRLHPARIESDRSSSVGGS
ncbi:MAG: hypothetical protein WC661_01315 [Opitutaceae bacterium]|jgi:hypothetical protein